MNFFSFKFSCLTVYIILKFSYLCVQAIGLMSRAFANGPGDRGSISGQVIPKT